MDRARRYLPHALIFFSSSCIMVVELVAGRLVARHLGSSLYTWTSIIGVVLAGMSIGNWIGGVLADRYRPRAILGWLFVGASAACLLTLLLNSLFADSSPLEGMHWPVRVFLTMLFIFLVPALALGTISPVTAKMALEESTTLGRTIGSVYAWGAVGSIFGTFTSGFWLIAALGVQGVVLVLGLALALAGLALGPLRWIHLLWVLAVVGLLVTGRSATAAGMAIKLGLRDDLAGCRFARDSHYQLIKVYDKKVLDPDVKGGVRTLRVLALDYLIHGYVDPGDPTYLHYDYEKVYRALAREAFKGRKKVSAFFIGGGSYTFPRWVLAEWPGSDILVAEIDPLVLEANHRALGLPRDTPIRTSLGDARNAVDDLPGSKRFDVILGDAFADLSVPQHLVTLEFSRKLARHLAPRGVYMINIIDKFSSALLLCSVVNTLQEVFPRVYVFTSGAYGVTGRRDTFVVVASRVAIDVSHWYAGHDSGRPGSALSRDGMRTLADRCKGRVLTDDDAPVENLLLPVIRSRR